LRGQPCRDFEAYTNTLEAPPMGGGHGHASGRDAALAWGGGGQPPWHDRARADHENHYRTDKWSMHDEIRWPDAAD
jgi:hypothetical protein